MKGMLTVLARELAEWRLLFLVALVLGLFPLALPWLPNAGGLDPAELRDATALGLAAVAGCVLAFVLGASVLARDLSERRLGFYFVRPLSGAAIWGGKMLGAAILCLGSSALVLLPAVLAGGDVAPTSRWGLDPEVLPFLLVPGLLLLLVGSHAGSVMVRSRSPWLAFDVASLALVTAAFWACQRLLQREGAIGSLQRMQISLVWTFLVVTAVAGLVQVVRGRTDLHRGHRLLSLTLWSLLGATALGSFSYARWVLGVTPRDLTGFREILPAPSGSWIALGGEAAGRGGYAPVFLFDLASGRSIKILGDIEIYRMRNPAFSRDGSRAVWMSWSAGEGYVLSALDLRRPGAVPVQTRISYPQRPVFFVIAPDGSRVAALWRDRVTVDDLRTGRMLVSQLLPDDFEYDDRLLFIDAGHLRIFRSEAIERLGQPPVWRLSTLDLEIATRRIVPVTSIEMTGHEGGFDLSPAGTHALLYRYPSQKPLLADLLTGRTMALPFSKDPLLTRFLPDGRLILTEAEGGRVLFRLLSSEGAEQIRIALPGVRLLIGGQPAPDFLAVAAWTGSSKDSKAWTSWLVDLETGHLRMIGRGLLPTAVGPREPGSLPARMFHRGRGDLLLFDPATGKLQTVLPGLDRARDLSAPWMLEMVIPGP
ncbi:MAG TPA: hypothetical protein VKM72_22565 [Thermoanaerobaculia bacterium]|nr:hypothetical protein [Thermoanaerobaculia bacterium]